MTETEQARLRAEIRALVAENSAGLGLAPAAALDLSSRLLAAGALVVGDRVAMPDGSNPIDYARTVFRGDPDAAHLFAQPEAVTHVPVKAAAVMRERPDVSTPRGAAKTRAEYLASLTARLAHGNGHE